MSLLWMKVSAWAQDYTEGKEHHPITIPVEKAGYAGWTTAEHMVEPGDKPHHLNEELMDYLMDAEPAATKARSTRMHVGLQEPVYGTQSHITERGLYKHLTSGGKSHGELPRFIRHKGNLYVDDGHHRVGAALLTRQPSIEAHYYDADKHGFPDSDDWR